MYAPLGSETARLGFDHLGRVRGSGLRGKERKRQREKVLFIFDILNRYALPNALLELSLFPISKLSYDDAFVLHGLWT